MDKYSKPLETKKTKLGILWLMEARNDPGKPGRELFVTLDDRFPLVENFKTHYAYLVKFLKEGNTAGNHYHEKKHELFIPVVGELTVILEETVSKQRETIVLNAEEHVVLYVRSGIAHSVTSKNRNDILLVLATSPGTIGDEYHYQIN